MTSIAGSSQVSSLSAQTSDSNTLLSVFRVTYPDENHPARPGSRKGRGARRYQCTACAWSTPYAGDARKHARSKHARLITAMPTPVSQAQIDSFTTTFASRSSLRKAFNRQKYNAAIVGILTRRRVASSAVEWEELKALCVACNPEIEDYLITSRRTAMRYILTNYDIYASQLRERLKVATSKIHISTDLWISPHRRAMLAVCAQWVDEDFMLQNALLALPEYKYSHSGERQARLIIETLNNFEIVEFIGYHTGDNATSNDTCLEAVSKDLQEVNFDPIQRRIRCIGYIIHLSLEAFLKATSKEALYAALDAASEAGPEMSEAFSTTLRDQEPRNHRRNGDGENYQGWQGITTLQKLHNIATWLRSSSLHSDVWDRDVGLRLGIDNATRWSSWYKVIDNAIKKKPQVTQFMTDYDMALGGDVLTGTDWDLLGKTHAFLKPFASATLYAEGGSASIAESLVLMDVLLNHYENAKQQYSTPESRDERMLHAINIGWFVLDKYHTLSGDVPAYAATLLLDPSRQLAYIQKNWPESWHGNAIAGTQQIWYEEYRDFELPTPGEIHPRGTPTAIAKRDTVLADLLKTVEVTTTASTDQDNPDHFIRTPVIPIDCTPLQWWCRAEQRAQYPRLSRMAINILSIPPESSEPERSFSGARRTASWDRLSITCRNLEAVECVGNWLRRGHIRPFNDFDTGLICEVDEGDDDRDGDGLLEVDVEMFA